VSVGTRPGERTSQPTLRKVYFVPALSPLRDHFHCLYFIVLVRHCHVRGSGGVRVVGYSLSCRSEFLPSALQLHLHTTTKILLSTVRLRLWTSTVYCDWPQRSQRAQSLAKGLKSETSFPHRTPAALLSVRWQKLWYNILDENSFSCRIYSSFCCLRS
jgi:hypothetical protein